MTERVLDDQLSGEVSWQQKSHTANPRIQGLERRYVKDGDTSSSKDLWLGGLGRLCFWP